MADKPDTTTKHMGDRANIKITGSSSFPVPVFFYTHWSGSELPEILKAALIRGKNRWDDPQYLARIIFCEMVKGYVLEEPGYGISSEIGDGDSNVITVDMGEQTVKDNDEKPVSFERFIS